MKYKVGSIQSGSNGKGQTTQSIEICFDDGVGTQVMDVKITGDVDQKVQIQKITNAVKNAVKNL